jgi:hypothetical protein
MGVAFAIEACGLSPSRMANPSGCADLKNYRGGYD